MTDRLHLPMRYRRILEGLLREHVPEAEVWAYGSRVTGESHEGSDLDLVVRGPDLKPCDDGFFELLEAIEQSNIPILVQAHDWARLPDSVHQEIGRDYVVVQDGTVANSTGEWQELTIGQIAEVFGGSTPSTKEPDNFDGDIPWLTPKDLSGPHDRYIGVGSRNLSRKGLESCSANLLPRGAVLLSTRAPIGYVAIAKNPIATNQGFRSLVVNENCIPEYIYYWLAANNRELEVNASGTTFQELSGSSLRQISISIPDKETQRRVAYVLGTLDDKIELNRRMNETLEEMARALFKSWFIDFDPVRAKVALESPTSDKSVWTVERARAYLNRMDEKALDVFPDRLVDSELGEIPEGWEVKALRAFGEIITGKTPSTKRPEYYGHEVPFLRIPDMHGKLYAMRTELMLSIQGSSTQPQKTLPPGSISVSCIATPGLVVLNHRPTQTNQQINSIIPHSQSASKYLFWTCRYLSSQIESGGLGGSVFGNMNKTTFSGLTAIHPGAALMCAFENLVSPIHMAILANEEQAETLAIQRDLLLPKLVSGNLQIS